MRVRVGILFAVLGLAIAGPWREARSQQVGPTRILGIVEIPSVFADPVSAAQERGAVTLRSLPASASEPVGTVDSPDQVEAREHGYEQSGAIVYGYRRTEDQTWYGVRLASGETGWLSEHDAGRFYPLTQLLDGSLAYMTDAWDGRIYQKAGRALSVQLVPDAGPETSIEIASSARIGNEIYFLVVILGGSICTAEEPGEVIAAGWVPAYADNGEVNLWYWSRGC